MQSLIPGLLITAFSLILLSFIHSICSLPQINNDIHKTNRIKSYGLAPSSTWPISIHNEEFEEITHPGDNKTKLSVPKFWSSPYSLMSADFAMRIGTYFTGKTDSDTNSKGSANERTIYVSIASYRDWQCRYTVESIFNRAKFPNRIRVGIVDQISNADNDPSCRIPIKPCSSHPNQALCTYTNQIDVMELDAILAVGPIFARHLGCRMYRGEYYAMQIDAHVTFSKDWDVDIIAQHDATRNEMAVLTTYLSDIEGALDEEGNSLIDTRPIMCNTDYEGDDGDGGRYLRHDSQPEDVPNIKGSPQLQPYWAAGFSFARGHFVVNVPYDLYAPMVFQGEEMSIGIRAFTYGYDHYAPERSVCFHTYSDGDNPIAKKRKNINLFWEHSNLYPNVDELAMERILGIIGMNNDSKASNWSHKDEGRYGVGNVRTTSKFYETFGINIVDKTVEEGLCDFVESGKMHRVFLKFLRKNGMGIDYSKISYRFKNK